MVYEFTIRLKVEASTPKEALLELRRHFDPNDPGDVNLVNVFVSGPESIEIREPENVDILA